MKSVAFCLVVVGLAIGAAGQTASAPDTAAIFAQQVEQTADKTLA